VDLENNVIFENFAFEPDEPDELDEPGDGDPTRDS
jgi:hypothetical protein